MNAPQDMILAAVLGIVTLAAVLAWKQLHTQPRPPSTPIPALIAARHRVMDTETGRPGNDEQWTDLTATVPGMSQRALAEAWVAAQRANARLGGESADLS